MLNPFTESMKLTNELASRGRPKDSKSQKCQQRFARKRTLLQYDGTNCSSESQAKKRKRRRPNKAHRDAYPNVSDEDIRRQLAILRKEKNRKSAQESRERRKKQEEYLIDRLPKGIQLKDKLIALNKKQRV